MKLKKLLASPVFSVVAFVLAAALLIFSSVGGARAALTIQSTDYQGEIVLNDIGVSLVENGEPITVRNYADSSKVNVSWLETKGDLLKNMLADGESLILGKTYTEAIAASNTGSIPEFVRVTVYKYWVDENGNKLTTLSPSLIDLQFEEGNGWVMDTNSSTDERTVMYYQNRLAVDEITPPMTSTLTIDPNAAKEVSYTTVKQDGDYRTFTTVYSYDSKAFVVEATVDAVQDHHADHAIPSAWGVKLSSFTQDGDSVSSVVYDF